VTFHLYCRNILILILLLYVMKRIGCDIENEQGQNVFSQEVFLRKRCRLQHHLRIILWEAGLNSVGFFVWPKQSGEWNVWAQEMNSITVRLRRELYNIICHTMVCGCYELE